MACGNGAEPNNGLQDVWHPYMYNNSNNFSNYMYVEESGESAVMECMDM